MNKERIKEIFENDPVVSYVINKAFDFTKIVTVTLIIYAFIIALIIGLFIAHLLSPTETISKPKMKQELHWVVKKGKIYHATIEDNDTVLIKYIGKYN